MSKNHKEMGEERWIRRRENEEGTRREGEGVSGEWGVKEEGEGERRDELYMPFHSIMK